MESETTCNEEFAQTTSPESPYYGSLLEANEVRLIRICRRGETISMRTMTRNLHNIVEFDAVSYVWGSQKASINIRCNDKDLPITPNVLEML